MEKIMILNKSVLCVIPIRTNNIPHKDAHKTYLDLTSEVCPVFKAMLDAMLCKCADLTVVVFDRLLNDIRLLVLAVLGYRLVFLLKLSVVFMKHNNPGKRFSDSDVLRYVSGIFSNVDAQVAYMILIDPLYTDRKEGQIDLAMQRLLDTSSDSLFSCRSIQNNVWEKTDLQVIFIGGKENGSTILLQNNALTISSWDVIVSGRVLGDSPVEYQIKHK